ncbi:hypothetical protein ACERIT_01850 [Halopenitus sp. H-Gu1]|uniref:DUF7289 family protein n=1 Tax=Halopenitus sp. H-Gu1 TaxID=3242697 RepID=UPI00359D8D84
MFRDDRRGVSEVIGFVLVFSLVIASVGIVFTVGLSGLQDARNTERVNNAERAFDVLAENHRDVLAGTPTRSTQIRLSDADIRASDTVDFEVHDVAGNTTASWRVTSIVFAVDDESIRFVNGAVIRESRDGAVMIKGPPGVVGADQALFQDVTFKNDGPAGVGGDRTVQIRIEHRSNPDNVGATSYENTTDRRMSILTDRPDPWRVHYEDRGLACTVDENIADDDRARVTCELDELDRFVVVDQGSIAFTFE